MTSWRYELLKEANIKFEFIQMNFDQLVRTVTETQIHLFGLLLMMAGQTSLTGIVFFSADFP